MQASLNQWADLSFDDFAAQVLAPPEPEAELYRARRLAMGSSDGSSSSRRRMAAGRGKGRRNGGSGNSSSSGSSSSGGDRSRGSSGGTGGRRRLQATPTTKDWRPSGVITPIRLQGSCGCCWAL